jgi:D-methionine transport system ATP-binding protein
MEQQQIITLKDVDSSYKSKTQEQLFLKGINLNVTAGEVLGIIGRSGSGKSALLRCIALLDRPYTGIVSIDNKNLTFLASKQLSTERRAIGLISSKPVLANSKTVYQNVALPLVIQGFSKDAIAKPVETALIRVGLDTKAQNNPTTLTVMQRILVDIARNLVNNPKILLCDDIFNGLDPKSTDQLVKLLRTLQQDLNLTLLIVSNDAEIIKALCQRVIVMQSGKIEEICSVYDLFTNPSSEIARDFIRIATKHELPSSLRRKIIPNDAPNHHALVRISFSDCLAPEEILSNSLDAFELKMNIIQAYQEKINNRLLSIMLIEIFGGNQAIEEAITFLNANNLQSEIIGYVPNLN